MKRKPIYLILAFILIMAVGCAGTIFNPGALTPARTYYEAQNLYTSAWAGYHTAWLALPETDPRKVEWVDKYHPKFLEAGQKLNKWQVALDDASLANLANLAVDELQEILIKLAIKQGGK